MDGNIKSMYTFIARCEELNASLKPVQSMAEHVKEIKKTLDILSQLANRHVACLHLQRVCMDLN